jgi:hypothetical protein
LSAKRVIVKIVRWILILLGVGLMIFGAKRAWLGHQSRSWPTAPAIVDSSTVESHRGGGKHHSTTYGAEIRYHYEVSGKSYSSRQVSFGDYGSSSRSHAASIANQYKAGTSATAHYQPSDPAVAVLEPGTTWSTFLPAILGAFTVGFAFLFTWMAGRKRAAKTVE